MSAVQLPLPAIKFDRLTPFDNALMDALRRAADPNTGLVRSLFNVSVRQAGLDYAWAHYRLGYLEVIGCVRVVRPGPGLPLMIWVLA